MHHITSAQAFWLILSQPANLAVLVVTVLIGTVAALLYKRNPTPAGCWMSAKLGVVFLFACGLFGMIPLTFLDTEKMCDVLNSPAVHILKVRDIDGALSVAVGYDGTVTENNGKILGEAVTIEQIKTGRMIVLNRHKICGLSRLNYKLAGLPLDQAVKVAAHNEESSQN